MLEYSHIKDTFLPLTREGITPKKLLISAGEMESLPSILSSHNFNPVMAKRPYGAC